MARSMAAAALRLAASASSRPASILASSSAAVSFPAPLSGHCSLFAARIPVGLALLPVGLPRFYGATEKTSRQTKREPTRVLHSDLDDDNLNSEDDRDYFIDDDVYCDASGADDYSDTMNEEDESD